MSQMFLGDLFFTYDLKYSVEWNLNMLKGLKNYLN